MIDIKHVFFDLDNTLWDFRKNSKHALEDMFKKHQIKQQLNVNFDEWHEFYYHKNEELWAALRDKLITKEELRERRFKETFYHFNIQDDAYWQTFENEYLQTVTNYNFLVEGAKELLDFLYPNYKLHILTNGFAEVSYRKINGANLMDYFNSVTTADELGVRKPDPKIFELSLSKANAQKHQSIYIGDDYVADVIGANAFGMSVIFFNALSEDHSKAEYPVVHKLTEIQNIL